MFTSTSRTGLNSPKKQGGGQETRQIEHVTVDWTWLRVPGTKLRLAERPNWKAADARKMRWVSRTARDDRLRQAGLRHAVTEVTPSGNSVRILRVPTLRLVVDILEHQFEWRVGFVPPKGHCHDKTLWRGRSP